MNRTTQNFLKCAYDLTQEQYETQLVIQGGVCAICRRTNPSKNGEEPERLSVDHNHRTGANRALLCQRCNKVLGFLEDSQELAVRVLLYLREHDGSEMVYPRLFTSDMN